MMAEPNNAPALRRGFTWTLWGLLFVMIDIPVGGWAILPDAVGYGLIALGLSPLAGLSPRLAAARLLAAGLAVLTLPGLFGFEPLLRRLRPLQDGLGFHIFYPLLTTVLLVVLVFQLLTAIFELARAIDHEDLAATAISRRNLFVVWAIVQLSSVSIGFAGPGLYALFWWANLAFTLAVAAALMMLRRAAVELGQAGQAAGQRPRR